jgi:hypothetical protein
LLDGRSLRGGEVRQGGFGGGDWHVERRIKRNRANVKPQSKEYPNRVETRLETMHINS